MNKLVIWYHRGYASAVCVIEWDYNGVSYLEGNLAEKVIKGVSKTSLANFVQCMNQKEPLNAFMSFKKNGFKENREIMRGAQEVEL